MAYKAQHTLNGVQLEMISYTMAGKKGKRFIEVYTQNKQTKMFMEESSITGKTLRISVYIDGYKLMLSNHYDMGMALHIFTDLVNKISINKEEQQFPIGFSGKTKLGKIKK